MTSPDPDETSTPPPSPSQPLLDTTMGRPPLPTSPFFRPTNPPPLDTTTGLSSDPLDEPLSPLGPDDDSDSAHPSTGSPRVKLRALKASIKGAIETAGGMAHQLLTREDTPEREVGLYLPDPDDVKAIGDPLAGLASRRAPESVSNPDVTDLISLVIGLAGYALKQQAKRITITRAKYLEGTVQDHDADQAPEPVDA